MEPITPAVAEKHMTQEQLADWIAEHLEPRECIRSVYTHPKSIGLRQSPVAGIIEMT